MAPSAGAQLGPSLGGGLGINPQGKNEFAVNVGLFRPDSRFSFRRTGLLDQKETFGRPGPMIVLSFIRGVTPYVGVGVEGGYISRGDRHITNVFNGAVTRVTGDTSYLMGMLRLRKPGLGLRPYVLGGFGGHHTELHLFGYNGGVSALVKDRRQGQAWTARGGLEYVRPSGAFLGVECGVLRTDTKTYRATAFGASFNFQDVSAASNGASLSLRMGTRFGS